MIRSNATAYLGRTSSSSSSSSSNSKSKGKLGTSAREKIFSEIVETENVYYNALSEICKYKSALEKSTEYKGLCQKVTYIFLVFAHLFTFFCSFPESSFKILSKSKVFLLN